VREFTVFPTDAHTAREFTVFPTDAHTAREFTVFPTDAHTAREFIGENFFTCIVVYCFTPCVYPFLASK
jgi:hypothetical protein